MTGRGAGLYHKAGIVRRLPVYTWRMSGHTKQRAFDRIVRLVGQGLDLVTLWRESNEALARAVPHYLSPCWYTLDPASLLVTSHFQTEIPEIPPEWLANEYFEDDFNKVADVVRSERGLATLHEATGGQVSRSAKWNAYIHPYGGDQELLVALRTRAGDAWGVLGLYREPGQPQFDDDELRFLQEVSPYLAEGARRALLIGEACDPEGPETPGLVILREDWSVESLTPGVVRWLAELPDSEWETRRTLPPSVLAVAGRAMRAAEHMDRPGEVPFSRVLARSGRWMALHGAALATDGGRRVSVIIEPAQPVRIASLLMSAYGLSEREQEVTSLVLLGNATVEIAGQLVVSAHTVQQHLKSIFDKTGVHSRRELVGKVFFSHYEPRLRDNEQRAVVGRPFRGGPLDRRSNA